MSTPAEARAAIGDALRGTGVLDANWTVLDEPPAGPPPVPCVVITPGIPYIVPDTFGQDEYRLRLRVLMPISAGLTALEEVITSVAAAAVTVDPVGLEQVTDVGIDAPEDSGATYLTASIDVTV